MLDLTADMVQRPGLYTQYQLLNASAEVTDFLNRFIAMEEILGVGCVNRGQIVHLFHNLTETARLVAERDKT